MKDPSIKEVIDSIDRFELEICDSVFVPQHSERESRVFSEVVESRSSRRNFSRTSIQDLGPLFYLGSRTKASKINNAGQHIEKRNIPSSGAMHTIDCLVSPLNERSWYVYNPELHSFDKLAKESDELYRFRRDCQDLIGAEEGFLIWYVCDFERLSSKYDHCISLALRESGSMSAVHSLIAEDLGLGFCMLGLLGYECAGALSEGRKLVGVGSAIVGRIVGAA